MSMSQGKPVAVLVVEESQDDDALIAALTKRVTARRKEPAAISEKNANQGSVTQRHSASLSTTRFRRDSQARSVFMSADLPSELGQRVRLRRGELDLSQAGLALKAGVSRSAIQRLETTGATPRAQTAHKIATALERPVSWLEGGAEGAEHGNDRSEGDGR